MSRGLARKVETANPTVLGEGLVGEIPVLFTEDYVAHVTGRDLDSGHPGVRRLVTALRRAFLDLEVEVEVLVAAKDRVAWQRTLRMTQRGDRHGFAATGRRLVWRDMATSRFVAERIAGEWGI